MLGGIISAILSLLVAELGAAFPLVVLGAVVSPVLLAFSALGLATYARVLVPALPLLPTALAAILLASAIAVVRIRINAWVTGVFLVVELAALALLVAVALLHPARSVTGVLIHPVVLDRGDLTPAPIATLGLATVSGAWSASGAGWALYFAEEMTDARRRIGRVIVWAGVIASLTVATPIVLIVAGAPDLKRMLAAEAPIADFLAQSGGPAVAAAVSVGVLAAIFNCMIAMSLAMSRFLYATGRDGVWPKSVNWFLTLVHPAMRSPIAATLLLGALGAAACFIDRQRLLVFLAGDVITILLVSLAVLAGRRRGRTGEFFRAPLHPLTPVFGLVVWVGFVAANFADPEAGRPSMFLLAGIFLASLAYYGFKHRSGRGWRMQPLDDEAASAQAQIENAGG